MGTRPAPDGEGVDPTVVVRAGYDALGSAYGEWASQIAGDDRARWLRRVVSLLEPGVQVLDLGCGPGRTAAELAQRFEVTGVDISEQQVAAARMAAPAARFIVDDMRTVDLPRGKFAAVVALYSLIHVASRDLPQVLGRIRSWMAPRGLLLATLGTVEEEAIQPDWLGVPMFFAGHTPAANRAGLADARFQLIADEVVRSVEPGEGEVAFHWLLARAAP